MRTRALLLATLVLSLAACARSSVEPPTRACACESAQPVVDATLLAFLSKAKALHQEADLAEQRSDSPAAAKALERIFDTPVPGGKSPAPEAEEVLADARARLAELRASLGQYEQAAADVDEGLAHARTPSYFRGHLYEVMGSIEEKRAAALTRAGKKAEAEDARKRAMDASESAVKIQDEVIRRAMEKAK